MTWTMVTLKISLEEQLLIKYCEIQRLIFLKFLVNPNKSASGDDMKNENLSNQESVKELNNSVIKNIQKRKVHLLFIDNMLDADLADMQIISKFNNGIRFLLYY